MGRGIGKGREKAEVILSGVVRGGLIKQVAFKERLEEGKEESNKTTLRKNVPGRWNSQSSNVSFRNNKEASLDGWK